MVEEHVALAHEIEDRLRGVEDAASLERGILQLGPGQVRDLKQGERIQQPVHVEQIPWADRAHASDVLELQLAQQQPAHVAPHPMLHFQSYDVAVGAPLRFLLNHVQQVLGASLVELEIAAARDTKGVGSLDLAPPIDEIQIGAHHVLKRYQAPAVRQGNEARQALRQLDVREVHRARRGVPHQDR